MPGSLKEETALLPQDYFQHRGGGTALPPSATAATLRRAAAELERRERPFFRSCAPLARAEPREAAALLRRVAAQLEADGGLNWGRLLALVVFAGTLAAALAERGCGDGPHRLAEALAAYLAEERGEWLREHGGWVSGAGGAGRRRGGSGVASPRAAPGWAPCGAGAGRCGAVWGCVVWCVPPGEAPRLSAPPAVGPLGLGAPGAGAAASRREAVAAGEVPAGRSVLQASQRLRLRLQASCQLSQRALNFLLSELASNIPLVQIKIKGRGEGEPLTFPEAAVSLVFQWSLVSPNVRSDVGVVVMCAVT